MPFFCQPLDQASVSCPTCRVQPSDKDFLASPWKTLALSLLLLCCSGQHHVTRTCASLYAFILRNLSTSWSLTEFIPPVQRNDSDSCSCCGWLKIYYSLCMKNNAGGTPLHNGCSATILWSLSPSHYKSCIFEVFPTHSLKIASFTENCINLTYNI